MLDRIDTAGDRTGTVQALYSAAVEGGDLVAALDLVRQALAADAAALWREGRGGRVLLARAAAGNAEAAALATALAGPGQQPGRAEEPAPPADAVRAVLQAEGGLRLVIARGAGAPPFGAGTLALAADLAGHLRMACSLAARIGAANVERQVYSSLLDKLAVGAVFLDARGQILQLTGMVRGILAVQDGLCRLRGGIAATAGHDDRRLQAAIRAALAGATDEPQVVPVGRASGQRGLGLVIHRIADRGGAEEARGAAVVILVRDPEHSAEPECTMLRRLFDLTAAEAEVARQLAAGLSLDEVSEALGIRRNTARAHLRAIFSKSGINRQSELIRLVLKSAAMLGEEPLRLAS